MSLFLQGHALCWFRVGTPESTHGYREGTHTFRSPGLGDSAQLGPLVHRKVLFLS